MKFDPGFAITVTEDPPGFVYGHGVFGPEPEKRTLDAIRRSLADPDCSGPEYVYSIVMDVGKEKDRDRIRERNLLYGAVVYARGMLGSETVHSQGHMHAVSPSCGMRTCELYEIWSGEAYIYMQEYGGDDPGRCYAVHSLPGDVVIVPPGWVHAAIVADPSRNLSFGAWCVRDYGFDYECVRRHQGIAWSYRIEEGKGIFRQNPAYAPCTLQVVRPRLYSEFGLEPGKPVYTQFEEDPDRFRFVADPRACPVSWDTFKP